jgi:mannose-6-phosphate isomerase-like protein (cupin superfamily)
MPSAGGTTGATGGPVARRRNALGRPVRIRDVKRASLDFDRYFEVVLETDDAQAAEMTVDPGRTVGGSENRHPDSDQWLFAASGAAVVTVEGEPHRVEAGDLFCIEAGEGHEIENDGEEPFETVNLYTPPRRDM